MTRADLLLVQQGVVTSRAQAQRLIAAGGVEWLDRYGEWQPVHKANQLLAAITPFRLTDDSESRYVSRGGLKLAGALQQTGLTVSGLHCLDIGQSTGGFSDCLLQHGASSVLGVDVGHSQLHARLCHDPRITSLEKMNARQLPLSLLAYNAGHAFDLAVMDVSFISQTLILQTLAPLVRTAGHVLSLVKPQFEAGPDFISKKGIVKKANAYPLVEQRIREAYETENLQVLDYFPSAITGGDGNREFFILARKR